MHTRIASTIALLLLALAAFLPAMASAAQALPDEVADPPQAMQPELEDPAPQGDGGVVAQGVAADEVTDVVGVRAKSTPEDSVRGVTAAPTSSTSLGSGSLPFTGVLDGRMTYLLLVGSLLMAAGTTAWGYGRVAAPAR